MSRGAISPSSNCQTLRIRGRRPSGVFRWPSISYRGPQRVGSATTRSLTRQPSCSHLRRHLIDFADTLPMPDNGSLKFFHRETLIWPSNTENGKLLVVLAKGAKATRFESSKSSKMEQKPKILMFSND